MIRTTNLLLCLGLLGVVPGAQEGTAEPGAASPDETRMLRLRDGNILWGTIADHEPDGLRFQRLDTGGTVSLPWAFLDPREEEALRRRLGYVDVDGEEVFLSADRLVLSDGTEIVGIIERRTEDHVYVKRAESVVPVASRLIVGASTGVQVPALEIYSKEELYQLKVTELQAVLDQKGEAGARAHLEVARNAERLFDYSNALKHYEIAAELAPDFNTAQVADAVARSREKAALQEQLDALEEIDRWRARKRYDRALAQLKDFADLHPDTPLLDDLSRLRARVERHQERDMRERVVVRFHYWTVELARRVHRQAQTFEAAVSALDEELPKAIVERVIADVRHLDPDVDEDEVMRLWNEREGGRYRQASYGLGTWLLGEDEALAVPGDEADEPEVRQGSQEAARRELEDRLERYFKNQRLARQAGSGGGPNLEEPEAFWKRARGVEKGQWILAYFVENSGLFRVERVRFSNCRECSGTGTRTVLYTGGSTGGTAQDITVACPTCHTIGRVRRVRYR